MNHALDVIVMKTLEKKAEDRLPTAKELLTELERWTPKADEPARKPTVSSTESSKISLSMPSPLHEWLPQDFVQKAFKARQAGRLADAADMMEEAFNRSPELRQKYANQVKLWRCGISM